MSSLSCRMGMGMLQDSVWLCWRQ